MESVLTKIWDFVLYEASPFIILFLLMDGAMRLENWYVKRTSRLTGADKPQQGEMD